MIIKGITMKKYGGNKTVVFLIYLTARSYKSLIALSFFLLFLYKREREWCVYETVERAGEGCTNLELQPIILQRNPFLLD